MSTRLPALNPPAIAFAHRGARAHAPENTLEAFELALRLGATGLESDVWVTADGVAVLDHDGWASRKVGRRRRIRDVARADLPPHIPALSELYERCGTAYHLSLDVKDDQAFEPTLAAARTAGAVERLWLCHPDWEVVRGWRARSEAVRLVDSTRLGRIKEGPERRAASLAKAGIDAVNLHQSDWTGGLVTLFHRFDVLAFGWDAQMPRVLGELFDMGIDAVYSDHVDRMVDALGTAYPS